MSTNTYLAVFLGSKDSPRMKAWQKLSDAERAAREKEGIPAWQAWMTRHQAAVVADVGGPLGKTKRITPQGVADSSNELSAFVVVKANSHAEAAKMFEGHPHITIFPGEAIEVMPVLPIPGG